LPNFNFQFKPMLEIMEQVKSKTEIDFKKIFSGLAFVYFKRTLIIFLLAQYSNAQTFSNTTISPCNTWDSGNAFPGLSKSVNVSSLPTLGTGAGEVVLKQVNLQLGTSACRGNLSTYSARLISPSGTIIQLFTNFTSTSTSQWIDIKYRDHASLERIQDYSTTTEQNYWPWSIGYYRTETAGAFSNVNGENPNGNWSLQIIENTVSEVSFEKVELVFGPAFQINDVTSSNLYDNCSGAQCVDNQSIVIGANSGFSVNDPNYPGNTFGGCSWNGNNNNSAWFQFTASSTTAYMTISGIANTGSSTSSDTQLLIARRSGDCSTGSWLSVPSGGCPDDESINNSSYLSTNGGVTTPGNVYSNGISANAEFNLSGLTVGATYYLYIDGNGGTPSTFYIEALSGTENCIVPLPVELTHFNVESNQRTVDINWKTESEKNNAYFFIQRSSNGIDWEFVTKVNGAGNSTLPLNYSAQDLNPLYGLSYYQLVQVDNNGTKHFNDIKSVYFETNELSIYPNPTTGKAKINGLNRLNEDLISITNVYGTKIDLTSLIIENEIDLSSLNNGVYYINLRNHQPIKVILKK
jgi:hypothetical protein